MRPISIVLAFLAILSGCGKEEMSAPGSFPPELVSFVPYDGNPVFAGTGTERWDKNIRERGWILRDADVWKMWYTGYNNDLSDTKFLGYATSDDGYHWTRYPGNPIFTERWVEDMMVVREGDTFYMVAEGRDDIAHMLVSNDGVHWEDRGDLDIFQANEEPIPPGPYGTPTLMKKDDVWYLFYERNDQSVWVATSEDMRVWKNVRDDPVIAMGPEPYDLHAVALNQVIEYKGRYYGYYHASAYDPWRDWTTCVAVSDDLVNWTKYPGNPVTTGDKSSGIIVNDGGKFRLYTMHPEVRIWLPKEGG